MNREIKFRGLTKEGKWVKGWYVEMPNRKLDIKDLGQSAISCEKKNAESSLPCIAYLPKDGVGLAFSIVIPETVGCEEIDRLTVENAKQAEQIKELEKQLSLINILMKKELEKQLSVINILMKEANEKS